MSRNWILGLLTLSALSIVAPSPNAHALGIVAEFQIPTPGSAPGGITTGPDGNLWFTESGTDKIGRISPQGTITEFSLAFQRAPGGIALGDDGNLWFTESSGNAIGQITPSGAVTEFPLPVPNSYPVWIATGSDGNLWFTEFGQTESDGNRIGRITPSGTLTEFAVPTAGSRPNWITSGPDGNLWFTEAQSGKVGRITTAGIITEFPVPISPVAIATGPDGNLWFTQGQVDLIGRISPDGVLKTPLAAGNGGIAMGPDGNLWAAAQGVVERIVGRHTNLFAIPSSNSAFAFAAGPDGNVWFTEIAGRIGVVTTSPEPSVALTPDSGPPGTQVQVAGSGFGSRERISLVFFGPQHRRTSLGSVLASQNGSFQAKVTIPSSRTGTGRIHASGDTSNLTSAAPFLVT